MAKRFLKLPEVKQRTGLSRSTIYAKIARGEFPRQIPLGDRAVGFLESTIDEWIDARVKECRDDSTGGRK